MKKLLLSVLIAALMITPLGIVAAAEHVEPSAPQAEESYAPGQVPARVTAAEAMSPAVHAVVLAMINHDVRAFDPADPALAWEALYNMLSMYGQLDSRSVYEDDMLVIPSETLYDYAAAILPDLNVLGDLPDFLSDRMTYDADTDSYLVACGSDGLAVVQAQSQGNVLSGSLVYLVDNTELAAFEAVLTPADTMFGRAIVSLELN